jgi:hypothetical protein
MYGEGIFPSTSTNNFVACVDDATSNNRWGIWKTGANAQINFSLSAFGTSQSLGSVSTQSNVKIVGSVSTGFVGGSVNGAAVLARADNTGMPVVTQFNIGKRASGSGEYMNGAIRRLTFWPQRLPNNTLQALTR